MPFVHKRVLSISIVAGILLCLAGPASAATVQVFCSGSTPPDPLPADTYLTMKDALNALTALGLNLSHTIILRGTCHNEGLGINGFSGLRIQAAPLETAVISQDQPAACGNPAATPQENVPALRIVDSHQINLSIHPAAGGSLVIRGGVGLAIEDSSVSLFGVTVENSRNNGLVMVNASSLNLNGRSGTNLTPNFIQNHCANGINVSPGSFLNVSAGNTVQNNGGIGIALLGNANLNGNAESILIQNNQGPGLNLLIGSSFASVGGQVTIQNNSLNPNFAAFRGGVVVTSGFLGINTGGVQIVGNNGPGIWADLQGKVRLGPPPPFNASPSDFTITGNAEEGVRILHMSVVWSNGGTASGNGVADVTCDGTSLLFGNVTGFGVNKCANTEANKKK